MINEENSLRVPWGKYYPNGYKLDYPDTSLYNLVEKAAKECPNNIAYNYFGATSNYKTLIEDIEKCAKALKVLDIKKDDVITICMPNTPEALISFYAINKIGGVANMIHPLSAENEIKYYLEVSNSKMLITIDLAWTKVKNIIKDTKVEKTIVLSVKKSMPFILKTLFSLTKERKIEKPIYDINIITWDEFIEKGKEYEKETNVHTKGQDVATILYSGGTTGLAKGIVLTNLNFNAIAIQNLAACPLKPTDKCLSIMPIFHGFGLRYFNTHNVLFRCNCNYITKL